MELTLRALLGGETRRFTLTSSPVRAGRASSNAIQLLDGTVSKEHAEFTLDSSTWKVRDLGSRNGTRVNGQDAHQALTLRPGDLLEVGHVRITVESADGSSAAKLATGALDSSMRMDARQLLRGPTPGTSATRVDIVKLIAEAGRLLVLPRPLRETCEELLRFVERAVPGNRAVILLKDAAGELTQVAGRYRGANATMPLALSQSILRSVLEETTAVITSDAMNDPRLMGQQSIIAQAIHSAMAVPLFDDEKVLGILYVDSNSPLVLYDQPQLELLTLLGNMAAVKISNARLLEAEQARLRMVQELATATRIQMNLLPEAPRDLTGYDCHARLETCFEVGGDLYDFHTREDGRQVVLVGDVSGKGMGAALLMSSTLSSARVLYDICDDPLTLVRKLNTAVHRSSDARSFVTLFVGYLETATGRLHYVNAGHPEPQLVLGQRLRTLEANGIPVGMLPTFPWTDGEVTLEPGEAMVVYTDGIPEAQRGEAFFEDERIAETLRAHGSGRAHEVADQLIRAVDEFAAGEHRSDDLTVVVVRRGA
jgi:serine phosphatase RsbU (regulator of sigma subunit)/pSer/pThr/pTyr-binding forkhead associated (FHA) protein